MGVVRECVEADIANGNEDEIAMLLLGPRQAVVFYLEGQLTRQHLAKAVEHDGFIDIPDVDVDGRALTVRVLYDPEITVATADSDGVILP